MPTPISVLMVEDSAADAELCIREIRAAGFDPRWKRVTTEAEFLEQLTSDVEVIIADHSLPHLDAARVLDLRNEHGPEIALIVVSGTIPEKQAAELMENGAADYLLKDRLTRLGPALRKALESRRLNHQARQDRSISELTNILQVSVQADEVYEAIRRYTGQLFMGTDGYIALYSASRDLVEGVAGWGEGNAGVAFKPDQCWALRRGRLHRFSRSSPGVQCGHSSAPDSICIPLITQGEVIGVLHMFEAAGSSPRGKISQYDTLAGTFAETLAFALGNFRLRETLRNQSIRDPVTGLFNRRYMEESLEQEIRRAVRASSHLTVLMLDIDHFKQFNDNFGHLSGDQILREVGRYLLTSLRGEDTACRFGGEEFAVILTGAGLDVAVDRAEKLRKGIEAVRMPIHRNPPVSVTASIGLGTFPDHGRTGADLLAAADRALYEAKAAGRNRVVAAASSGPPP
jgi:diguanylate cyclase (GGDEF)-like protein